MGSPPICPGPGQLVAADYAATGVVGTATFANVAGGSISQQQVVTAESEIFQ